jgi:membrane protein YdbS with pleckstrin-like domain
VTRRERLLLVLRVPPPPVPPQGDEDVRVFRAAPAYFHYKVLVWLMTQGASAVALIIGIAFVVGEASEAVRAAPNGPFLLPPAVFQFMFLVGEAVAVIGFLGQLVLSGLVLRLDFEQRWYMVSDRSLRIREGIVKVEEKTMTFANIQQVAIRQNPVQRWLGIADLEVRTAGGGGGKQQEQRGKADLHAGYFRGVSDAPLIRDAIRDRLRRHADAGLGDPDDHEPAPAAALPTSPDLATAAAMLRDEARALRVALS